MRVAAILHAVTIEAAIRALARQQPCDPRECRLTGIELRVGRGEQRLRREIRVDADAVQAHGDRTVGALVQPVEAKFGGACVQREAARDTAGDVPWRLVQRWPLRASVWSQKRGRFMVLETLRGGPVQSSPGAALAASRLACVSTLWLGPP